MQFGCNSNFSIMGFLMRCQKFNAWWIHAPDFCGVFHYGTVAGEFTGSCNVTEAHARPVHRVTVQFADALLTFDVGTVVFQQTVSKIETNCYFLWGIDKRIETKNECFIKRKISHEVYKEVFKFKRKMYWLYYGFDFIF